MVLRAATKVACNRWYAVGLELGFTDGQIDSLVKSLTVDADRLRRIVNQKAVEVGDENAARLLLEACSNIDDPVIEKVLAIIPTSE